MRERLIYLARHFKLNFAGLLTGFLLYCFSLTPSLLPRPPFFVGFISGLSFAVGYGIGLFASWGVRRLVNKEVPVHIKKVTWKITLSIVGLAAITYGIWATRWQNEVRRLVGESEFHGQHVFTILIVAFLAATIMITLARLIHKAIYRLSEFVERWLPRRISFAIGTFIVGLILVWFYNGVLLKTFITVSNDIYRSTNDKTKPGVVRPDSLYRSGSDASLISWDSIGRQGRSFVASGPTQEQLATFNGKESSTEPIRIYAGVKTASNVEERARIAVKELERTGAFARDVLVVMTPTGTGWIESQTADALEYMWNGNTALVAMQYSYLPSWISFMVDQENSVTASRALFNAVYDEWQTLPTDHRPKLLVYGLSLGSFGAQGVFSGASDIQNRTDGGLFVGTPNRSQPWGYFVENRDAGSPEWQPAYQNGAVVRFAATSDDLSKPTAPWGSPRIVYLQHASDPIVWWNPDIIWHEPDWLEETRGPDVTPNMQWYPFVTFFQVTVDQFFATFVPHGHGHNYSNSIVAAWTAVASPPNWTEEKANQLQMIIDAFPTEHS